MRLNQQKLANENMLLKSVQQLSSRRQIEDDLFQIIDSQDKKDTIESRIRGIDNTYRGQGLD